MIKLLRFVYMTKPFAKGDQSYYSMALVQYETPVGGTAHLIHTYRGKTNMNFYPRTFTYKERPTFLSLPAAMSDMENRKREKKAAGYMVRGEVLTVDEDVIPEELVVLTVSPQVWAELTTPDTESMLLDMIEALK